MRVCEMQRPYSVRQHVSRSLKPGTCPVHRIMSDGRQRGRGKELRHTAAVSFAKWAGMICLIRSDTEVRGALPAPGICSPRLCWSWPATRALLRYLWGPCSAGVIRGARLRKVSVARSAAYQEARGTEK